MPLQPKYNKVALIIMDGWGKEVDKSRSAIYKAQTPNVDSYYSKYPNSTLVTYGEAVGLPDGQMGNSEVGHMNLGAGRVVYQDLVKINKSIKESTLESNPILQQTLNYCVDKKKPLHLMGLVSDGGVHSHIDHCIALAKIADAAGVSEIYIHVFTDGRDCAPDSALEFINRLESELKHTQAKIASIIGRYYAMDRDNRWERIKKAYDLLVHAKGDSYNSASQAIQESYKEEITDEFILPKVIVDANKEPITKIKETDAVLCFNFRTDRCREISIALTQQDLPEHNMKALPLHYSTITNYDKTFQGVPVLFEKDNLVNTLGEVLSKNGKTQLRMAETEKYPHVTFFFSGGREVLFDKEARSVSPSPKVATYDLQPEMSARDLTDALLKELQLNEPDFICLNYANTDMVGHTGVFEAAVKAAETVDSCVGKVVNELIAKNYAVLLTADHGNADIMMNEDGSPHTAHTTNLVPLFFISKEANGAIKDGKLGDIAPTILNLMGIEKPAEMTGDELI